MPTCPTCRRSVEWNDKSPYRPFCSERCKLIDLGAWASERHAIPGDVQIVDDDVAADGESFAGSAPDSPRKV